MASPSTSTADEPHFPPLPNSGPAEDSALAQQNFSDRERASRSWLNRLLPANRIRIAPLQRRRIKLVANTEDEDEGSHEALNASDRERSSIQLAPELDEPVGISTVRLPVAIEREHSSQDTGRIALKDDCADDPLKDEHLYRWAMVYENQRG